MKNLLRKNFYLFYNQLCTNQIRFTRTILITVLILLYFPIQKKASCQEEQEITLEIDRIKIIEDRDRGAGEIYVKVFINNNPAKTGYMFRSVNDGDEVQLDWIVFSGNCSQLSIRIEVWESDEEYVEAKNDYLGHVNTSWWCNSTTDRWYDCNNPIGGNSPIQAQVYLIFHRGIVDFPPIVPESQIDYSDILGLIMIILLIIIFGLGILIIWSKKVKLKKPLTIFTPPKKPFSKALGTPFFCQVDNEQHPATDIAYQCQQCSRFVCEKCFLDMKAAKMATCPMCGGILIHKDEI
ncbi:MAG: hypothetical protein JSW11_08820 [Candidatus Heimdallarchaeota archaeon]|nr:MAG: hypothetical protein JSW11_08820 [Candidatus Heimdallarchaeota archaeon]